MIRPGTVWDVARAEMRLTRRLARYWVFQVAALLAGCLFYLQYNFIHLIFSSYSGSAAMINPRFLLSFVGIWYLLVFLLGLVFLGFEIRARDERELIVEVFDTLPISNLELIAGRFLGILIACWIPAIFSLAILSLIGILGFKSMPLPESIAAWIIFMAIPAYALILGLTFFLTFVLKNRLIAGVVTCLIVIGVVVLNLGFAPVWFLPAVDLTGGFMIPPLSDFTPHMIDIRAFSQRAGFLLFAVGFLLLSALLHPRKDDASRSSLLAGAIGSFLIGGLLVGWLVQEGRASLADLDRWKAAHEAHLSDALPDVTKVTGNIDISARTALQLDLAMQVRAPETSGLDTLLFTLNPGLEVRSVKNQNGTELPFTTADALLQIKLDRKLPAGTETTISLVAGGALDPWYGYIDATIRPLAIDMKEGNLFALGFMNSLTEKGVVALLPGSRWFPSSGPDVQRGGKGLPVDFFEVDVTVQVPSGWLVAGPAKRQEAGEDRYRFATVAPIPDLALVASNYVTRSVEIEGITMEVLLHPKHTSNLQVFEEAGDLLRKWVETRLSESARVGLNYPYDVLTLVEVPNHLRGYAGGWRLDSTLTQPAMVLTRESGFPTARFDRRFEDRSDFEDHEDGVPGAKRDVLTSFFENDFTGGNPFMAVARSYFGYQTRASGELAIPLDFVYEDLTNQLVSDRRAYFSAHIMASQGEMQQVFESLGQQAGQQTRRAVSDIVIDTMTSRSDVWSTALDTSLADLNPWETPKKSLNVLTLKGGAMARSLMDSLGTEKSGAMVASLRKRGEGKDFSERDVATVGEEIDVDLEGWMNRWMHDTALPGFVVVDTTLDRIRDDQDGTPNYQLSVKVSNGEPVRGMVKLEYLTPSEGGRRGRAMESSDPVEIPANGTVEIGVVTSTPPSVVYLSPYLSLNRDRFSVNLPSVDEKRIVERDPFAGSREVAWQRKDDGSIVVDDLDSGFSLLVEDESGMRVAGRGVTGEDTDGGLPITTGRSPSRWSRRETALAHGRYRHTVATVKAGDGNKRVQFSTEIPKSGLWELSYYVPTFRRASAGEESRSRRSRMGTWHLEIRDPSGTNQVTLNADDADPGWYVVGEYEIAQGDTAVIVSNQADNDGRYVVADAVRWTPVNRKNRTEATQ